MKNNFSFWNEYNRYLLDKLNKILLEKSDFVVDMHIHTKYSDDGFDCVKDKIDRAKRCGFDIIAITDHDNVEAYDELFSLIDNDNHFLDLNPIIIPGVEYTVDYDKYDGLCHVLQYFVNPKSEEVEKRLLANEKAFWERSKLQFNRIDKNYSIQKLINDYNVGITYDEYVSFLQDKNEKIPSYTNLINYLFESITKSGVTISDVKKLVYEMVECDTCSDRKRKYTKVLERFEQRHGCEDIDKKQNLLLPLLAPVGIDDVDYQSEPLGVLTVNRYGQLKLKDLTSDSFYVLAHPEVEQIDLLRTDIPLNYSQIIAYEINKSNYRSNIYDIKEMVDLANVFFTIGSDSHSIKDNLYDDKSFYNYPSAQLKEFVKKGEIIMNIENTEKMQYSNANNLNARIRLHEKYSINKEGFHEWVFSKMNMRENMRILECGCGPGMLWRKNINKIPNGCKITLLDMSEGMLKEASENINNAQNFSFEFLSGDIQNIPFPDETFDIVIANHMLYHVPDINKGLMETRRVLKENGILYASTFGLNHLKELDSLTRKYVELGNGRKSDRFTLENGYEMIKDVYGNVNIEKHDDGLIVTEPHALIDYILSGSKAQEQLIGRKKLDFENDIIELFKANKKFIITKDAGVFLARKVN